MTLGVWEAYLWFERSKAKPVEHYSKNIFMTHDLLGYAPIKADSIQVKEEYEGELIYDVVYTLNANGLRISPPYQKDNQECLLFFGGSFTFGVGVNDKEAMPYQVGMKSNGKYRSYNFGVGGYGPHQMLSAIEHQIVEKQVACEPTYAIYQALIMHTRRSAGLEPWDRHGPKYILGEDGEVRFVGHFDDAHNPLFFTIHKQLNKSFTYQTLFQTLRRRNKHEHDIQLFVKIISRSKALFEITYPQSEFHLLLWDDKNEKDRDLILKKMRENDIRVHLISDILPNYQNVPDSYAIHPLDKHPNALAHEIIAEYIINHIINFN